MTAPRPARARCWAALALALALWVQLAGCAPSVPVAGDTRTDAATRADLARKLALLARQLGPCQQVDAITATVQAVQAPVPDHPDEFQRLGRVAETWEVRLCGQSVAYRITHGPDAQGRVAYGYALQRR